ncbi:hypothetical protein GGS20DRAFT_526522 [Poronia punctata]|nr:hypothetical protein GGS20DRAFT_526522 [Poronia punctata]
MTSMSGYGPGSGNYGSEGSRERGTRRRKLAAMAGSVYRAGAVAVNEIKESYNQTRSGESDTTDFSHISIPGSFPDVAIITKGNEQMVLFPSYAKRHVKGQLVPSPTQEEGSMEYWQHEYARHEDEKAIMDVDVRGWIYNPHKGPMTRRNRVLIGLARQLSGIPAPRLQQADNMAMNDPAFSNAARQNEEERERESIAREAREIEQRGQAEELAAEQGGYSEQPRDQDSEEEGDRRRHGLSGRGISQTAQASPIISSTANTSRGSSTLSDAELAVANANLMARIGPFMTTPLVQLPITLFFFNDTQSHSRTIYTDDSGHFSIRAALDFVPTHVRVLVNEDISCVEPIKIIEPRGISLISDIDDTIKRSNISLGAREIFRNTFVRDLGDLTIEGVKDWYNMLHEMGVMVHYCSNSPWQLYPVIATYFKLAGLPPGSLHLKRYSGMLQGIFEPVAERKKGTLEKIMTDFPERMFLLVGDSGEADLEVYTELVVANPGRIKAIFIRDVTTPEKKGYFDSAFDAREDHSVSYKTSRTRRDETSTGSSGNDSGDPPKLPPRSGIVAKEQVPFEADLIDLSDEATPTFRSQSEAKTVQMPKQATNNPDTRGRKPPPRPVKPSALQSTSTSSVATIKDVPNGRKILPPPPPPPRSVRSFPSESSTRSLPLHPLSRVQTSSALTPESPSVGNTSSRSSSKSQDHPKSNGPPPPPPPRRRGTPSSTRSSSPFLRSSRRRMGESDTDYEPFPGPSGSSGSGTTTPPGQGKGAGSPNQEPLNKKLELWRRRLERAQDILSQHGVPLYTWRRGEEVVTEAVGIVREAMRELGIRDRKF